MGRGSGVSSIRIKFSTKFSYIYKTLAYKNNFMSMYKYKHYIINILRET